jgi:hypothetical protein
MARILHRKIGNCAARKCEAPGTDVEKFDLRDFCMHPLKPPNSSYIILELRTNNDQNMI